MPKTNPDYTYLAVINVDSSLKKNKKYYLQVFAKECKCIEKELIRFIIGDPEIWRIKKKGYGIFFKQNNVFGCVELFYEL